MFVAHSNHVTSSKRVDTLICHTTMRRNPINFLYNPGHVTLWSVEVGPVANAREVLEVLMVNNVTGYKLLDSYLGIYPHRTRLSLLISIYEFTIYINFVPFFHILIILYILMYNYKLFRKLNFTNVSNVLFFTNLIFYFYSTF